MRRRYAATLALALLLCGGCASAAPTPISTPLATPAQTSTPAGTPVAILLSDQALDQKLKALLVAQVIKPAFGGQVVCAYRLMDAREDAAGITSYLAVFCQEFYLQDGQLVAGSGANDFATLTLQRSGDTLSLGELKLPQLSNYNDEVRAMFPTHLHAKIFSREYTPALDAEARAEAARLFAAAPTP